MKICVILFPLLVWISFFTTTSVNAIGPLASCPDSTWIKYKDTKCFKLLNRYLDWEQAKEECAGLQTGENPSRLATINSQDEQDVLQNYLFNTSNVINNVWLGATRSGNGFLWIDGKSVSTFTNWAPGSPSSTVGRDCVQIQSGWTKVEGQGEWKDVNCAAGNWAVCESFQVWDAYEVQMAIIALRDNPVPIGFVYVQLPIQPEPNVIWPQVKWQDVTADYAGLFFRAEGGGSAAFGSVQEDSTRHFSHVEYYRVDWDDRIPHGVAVPSKGWSPWVRSAYDDTGNGGFYWYNSMRFHNSDVEVRPRNTASRVWKRSA